MYGLHNLYKQLLDLHVQMDEAAKPKVFIFLLYPLNLIQEIGL